ncbi:cytochrome P450 71A6-like [Primulina huaijiensis]|uniref:cytochrome P450 71A6-like n=1 Tax=Primulina huaijiensis TaxID=1492673 RepID=UPI003CC6EC49
MVAFSSVIIIPLFSTIFFIIFLYKWRYNTASKPGKTLPPSPRKLPIIGNLHQLTSHPHRFFHSLSKHYGPLLMVHFGSTPVLVASSADAAREIMKNKDLIFASRPKMGVAEKMLYGSKDVVFAPYSDYWRQMRSICVLHLLSNKMVQSFRHVREEETSAMIERIKGLGSAAINFSDMFSSLTNDVVCRVVLGRKYVVFEDFVRRTIEVFGTMNIGDYFPWLAWINKINGFDSKVDKVCKDFDEFLEGVIRDHRYQERQGKEYAGSDFVDILLEFQRENQDTSPIDDEALKALLLDMFVGGTDTTQTHLEWTLAELLKHPKIMAKLQKEVRQIAGTKQEITEDDVEKMRYLKAVTKESLRLHPPVPLLVPRVTSVDTNVLGYDVAAGTKVLVSAWTIGRDPSLWKNPEEFNPERFFETSIDFRGLHFEFIPFGAGRRGCPGISFAIPLDELALAKLLHKFDITLPNGVKEEDLDMTDAIGMTVHKNIPVFAIAA